jgi:hypothetical protein
MNPRLEIIAIPHLGNVTGDFHFYAAQETVAWCAFSRGKAATGLVTLHKPEVKML